MLQANFTQENKIQFNEPEVQANAASNSQSSFNIQIELDNLEDLILDGTRIPLSELTILDGDLLLDHLNQIQENLPVELATAIEIVNRRQEIISEAERYACLLVKSAEEKATQIVQESAVVRQAELDGAKIRLKTEQECEQLKQITYNEVQQLQQDAIADCKAIQIDADNYANSVLGDIEQKLQEMLAIIQNGRQQLDQVMQK